MERQDKKTIIFSAAFKECFFPWATAGLVALSSNWAAEAIAKTYRQWRSGTTGSFNPDRTLAIALFLGSMYALYRQRNTLFKPRTRFFTNEAPEKRAHLVLFLSQLRDAEVDQNGIPHGLTLTWNLDDDLVRIEEHKATHPPWPWEMGLRALRHHRGKLVTVTVTCSTRTISEVNRFLGILAKYQELAGVEMRVLFKGGDKGAEEFANSAGTTQGLDFEDFDELTNALWSFLERGGFTEEEVMIDITGGQKVTSAVAMALTFNRRLKAQYVQTNDPWRVVSYDVVHTAYDSGSQG